MLRSSRRPRYSIHLIDSTGAPRPVGSLGSHDKAIDAAEAKARTTHLETRVWDTREARCIYTVPAQEALNA